MRKIAIDHRELSRGCLLGSNRELESAPSTYYGIVNMLERWTNNPDYVGSNPALPYITITTHITES